MSEEKQKDEECPWCGTTGELKKTRKTYWITVAIIFGLILLLFILSQLL